MTRPGRVSRKTIGDVPARPGRPGHKLLLSKGVTSVGLASLFSDAGHEMTTSLLPTFVATTLRSSAAVLGIIEGISDGILGLATLLGGGLANDEGRRLRLARGGYLSMAVTTGLIGAALAVWQVALLRAASWLARGIRSPSRDSILISVAPGDSYGRAFGIERAGDNLGAVIGPLCAAGLIGILGIRPTLMLAALPMALAAVAITVAAAEAAKLAAHIRRRVSLELGALRRAGVAPSLLPIALFEISNVSTTLLILRSTVLLQQSGRGAATATSLAVLIYAGHNVAASGVAFVGGRWIDARGPRLAFASGAIAYAIAYADFAYPLHSWWALLLAFSLAGSGIGLAEPAESTLLAQLLPAHLRGSGFGILGALQSFGGLASSAVVGLIWTAASPTAAFFYAAAWMLVAASSAMSLPRGRLISP